MSATPRVTLLSQPGCHLCEDARATIEELHAAIDAAYHTKYDRYGPAIVGTVVGDKAAPVTIRLVPAP